MIGKKATERIIHTNRLKRTHVRIPPHEAMEPVAIMYAPDSKKDAMKSNFRIPAATIM
jgi:hypothetical protein